MSGTNPTDTTKHKTADTIKAPHPKQAEASGQDSKPAQDTWNQSLEAIIGGRSDLDKIISPEAREKLDALGKEVKEGLANVGNSRVPVGVAKEYIDHKLEKAVSIILDDIDKADKGKIGPDGKLLADGSISKAVIEDKMIKAAALLQNSHSVFAEIIGGTAFIKAAAFVNPLGDTIPTEDLQKTLNGKIETLVDGYLSNADRDANGKHTGLIDKDSLMRGMPGRHDDLAEKMGYAVPSTIKGQAIGLNTVAMAQSASNFVGGHATSMQASGHVVGSAAGTHAKHTTAAHHDLVAGAKAVGAATKDANTDQEATGHGLSTTAKKPAAKSTLLQ